MGLVDIGITAINVIITGMSFWGAARSVKYYKKSKSLTAHTNLTKALLEIDKMLSKLPDALSATNKGREKRGESQKNIIESIGKKLAVSYNEIHRCIPVDLSDALTEIEKTDSFNLQTYINEYINGDAIAKYTLNMDKYNQCQECLLKMQVFLKKKIDEKQEELK